MLENKVALITGSSRGIGHDVARLYLENKARVVICGSKLENAEKTVEEFVAMGFDRNMMLPIGVDMSNAESIRAAVDEVIKKFGRIDILVNNAGITGTTSLLELSDEELEKMFNINVFGLLKMTREVVKHMKEYGGSIINTSSMVGINGGRNQVAYASSKFAVNGITVSLAKELGMYNIRVNAVAPGAVNTDMMKSEVSDEMKNMLINLTPLRRVAELNDLSGAYLYLASDYALFTTGTIIKIDGGAVSMVNSEEQPLISVSVMKKNNTNEVLKNNSIFALSVLSKNVDSKVIETFGYHSMRDYNKFDHVKTTEVMGVNIVDDSIGYMILEKVDTIDLVTHDLFIGLLIEDDKFNNEEVMTYGYYQEHKDDFIKVKTESGKDAYVCTVCGYIHYGDFPLDFKCPICGVDKTLFKKQG